LHMKHKSLSWAYTVWRMPYKHGLWKCSHRFLNETSSDWKSTKQNTVIHGYLQKWYLCDLNSCHYYEYNQNTEWLERVCLVKSDWYHKHFHPEVWAILEDSTLTYKAVLLPDNTPSQLS
jgi:hypothetical protein